MTVKEASVSLGISESYIRSHLKRGDINCYTCGYPIRLTSSEIDIFVLPFKYRLWWTKYSDLPNLRWVPLFRKQGINLSNCSNAHVLYIIFLEVLGLYLICQNPDVPYIGHP